LVIELGLGRLVGVDGGLKRLDAIEEVRCLVDLRGGEVELTGGPLERRRNGAESDRAFVGAVDAFPHFLARCEEIRAGAALDAVVCHDYVDDVVGPAPGHVAFDAAAARLRFTGVEGDTGMAAGTGGVEGGGSAAGSVGVVAGCTGHSALALQKAPGLAQAVAMVSNLKMVGGGIAGREVEMDDEVREGLLRTIGEGRPIEAANGVGQGAAGGFEVALEADFKLSLLGGSSWIEYGSADFGGGPSCRSGGDMGLCGTMTTLAVDTRGEFAGAFVGVAIVAEHAFV
jgi:hypothetical protein